MCSSGRRNRVLSSVYDSACAMRPAAGRQQGLPNREVLAGSVERVTFHNPENGFCVLRTRARGHRELATVVGHAATVAAREWLTASGEWANDRTYGQQFRAHFIRTAEPPSMEGIEKYTWQIEGEKAIVVHAGRAIFVVRRGRRLDDEFLPDGNGLRHACHPKIRPAANDPG